MLQAITEDGTLQWHCHTPSCSYHNCQGWDRGINCTYHANQHDEPAGQTHLTHISDPDVRWTAPDLIELPLCPECGEKMTVLVHREIAEPIIKKDELTNKILQVRMPEGFEHHGNLWFKDADMVRKAIPHETMAHLPHDLIKQQQEQLRSIAPDVPVAWMLQEMIVEDIHSVYQHPAVARHRELADQLIASGKVYVPPIPPEVIVVASPSGTTIGAPNTYTEEQVEAIVTRLLQEHGVITSPRLPAMEKTS